jgi:hypothetical protein
MTIEQTIEIPAEEEIELELLLPRPKPLTKAEEEAHTQYILRELAKAEKKIAEGKAVWLSDEEFWAKAKALL